MKKLIFFILFASASAYADPVPRFTGAAVWNQNIATATLHPDSASMISTLAGLGGFGNDRMQIDFGLHIVHAAADAPTRTIVSHPYGYFSPDCEPLGTALPVPSGAAIEGESDLVCDNQSNDCHLLVVQNRILYETYGSTASGAANLEAWCLAIWYLDAEYPPEGRGEHCTSADAAGFPIAPLLFNADDIANSLATDSSGDGDLGHAVRFILPNARMATDPSLGGVDGRLYVRPASHAGGPSGPVGSIPYGARLRLRADFPLTGYSPAVRVILNTFKRYGIVLADGGTIALTAESDLYTTTTWDELGIDSRIFDLTPGAAKVEVTDFEVIDTGPRIGETYECDRTTIPAVLFADGFESGDVASWPVRRRRERRQRRQFHFWFPTYFLDFIQTLRYPAHDFRHRRLNTGSRIEEARRPDPRPGSHPRSGIQIENHQGQPPAGGRRSGRGIFSRRDQPLLLHWYTVVSFRENGRSAPLAGRKSRLHQPRIRKRNLQEFRTSGRPDPRLGRA